MQLMAKHRLSEINDSQRLAQYEKDNESDGFSILHGSNRYNPEDHNILTRFSSFRIWFSVICGFFILAIYAIIDALLR